MRKAKPSPLPWGVDDGEITLLDADGLSVAQFADRAGDCDEQRANVALAHSAVAALHAIAPGRELEAAAALPTIVSESRELLRRLILQKDEARAATAYLALQSALDRLVKPEDSTNKEPRP